MINSLVIRPMSRPEVDELVNWAAREGWNPGLHDAELFWATDPDAFVAAEVDQTLIGGGAITSYDGAFGFMGFFIVQPEFRGLGLGNALWHARRERLLARLRPGASIGMDGVFAMQAYYAEGGFVFSHRDIRFRAEVPDLPAITPAGGEAVTPLAEVAFEHVVAYDQACFPAARPGFLRGWLSQPDALALGCHRNGRLSGYGVIRRCREGCKIGPLFADDAQA
ncbi:MAG: GNAT family N-acetyltransferase, partial [Thiohalocapsa sp.]